MVYIPGGFSMLEPSMRRVEEKIVWCALNDVVLHIPPLTHHLNGGVDTSYLLSLFLAHKKCLTATISIISKEPDHQLTFIF